MESNVKVAVAAAASAAVAGYLYNEKKKKDHPMFHDAIPVTAASAEAVEKLEAARKQHAMKREPYDGCLAALTPAYQFAETIFIYPITPTTPLGEAADEWATAGKTNAFGLVPKVQQMQSETGAVAGVHGTLVTGGLSTTFTASQGLLLMIPNLIKIAGELLPCVLHVAARALAGQALSIFGDHSDVMAVRYTGMAMLCSHSVQESLDLSLAAEIATFKSSVPFIHFFDGMRTSHEIQKIEAFGAEHMQVVAQLLEPEFDKFRARSLNPNHPTLRGTAQSPDIHFQNQEAMNLHHGSLPEILRTAMQWIEKLTGRHYDLFKYHGHPQAEDVIVSMGSSAQVIEELIDHYGPSRKVGVLKVHLFRPWSLKHFLMCMPRSVKRVAVLDRCKEHGVGEPLYTDVKASLQGVTNAKIIGGRYGLGGKDFSTGMAHSVFENLRAKDSKHPFTVGIVDDVTNLSLAFTPMNTVTPGTVQCMFYGFGSDGTVGANKSAIKLISQGTNLYTQGYFAYDALKAGGITCSHLRFGPSPIKSSYEISAGCTYVAIHKREYLKMFAADHLLQTAATGATLVLNTPWTDIDTLKKNLPQAFREIIVKRELVLYNIDALSVARQTGMGKLINNIMQTVFFHLAEVIPPEEAIGLFKKAIEKTYKHKGTELVKNNHVAVDQAIDNLKRLDVPADFAEFLPGEEGQAQGGERRRMEGDSRGKPSAFVTDVLDPVQTRLGDTVPVSKFQPGGQVETGMTQWAKRAVANCIPVVDMDKCTQCNKCSTVCPHAVIRPFLASPAEMKTAPKYFDARKATGGNNVAGLSYSIRVSPMDCTGCEVCVNQCPDNALKMAPTEDEIKAGAHEAWNFSMKLKSRGHRFDPFTAKGSQFQLPLLEFSGACEGCGETPYAKLLTQLFGKRLILANTTGCSSIWGGPAGWVPYTKDIETGQGVAWGNSLFEDNAEYGLGMVLSITKRRELLTMYVQAALKEKLSAPLQDALEQWLDGKNHPELSKKFGDIVIDLLKAAMKEGKLPPYLKEIWRLNDLLMKPSMWMQGGDGWANDIGFGGLDHAIALGEDVNILVLDTEVYSNTGGQSSKATPLGSVAKFAQKGRRQQKKDLGGLMMTYQGVYVASVSMGASHSQCVKAMQEAEAHPGPSLVMCYAPCIEHRPKNGMGDTALDMKRAVDCGYWPLYRYDPQRSALGEPPFQLDSPTQLPAKVEDFLLNQNRYSQLQRSRPEDAANLRKELTNYLHQRHADMKEKSKTKPVISYEMSKDTPKPDGPTLTVAFGSDTGTAEGVARRFTKLAKSRGCTVNLSDLNDVDLSSPQTLVLFVATCGDGDIPPNAKAFYAKELGDISQHKFLVFALGDTSYAKFCEAGKLIDTKLSKGGAQQLMKIGCGNACDEDGWETQYAVWLPEALKLLQVPEVKTEGPPAPPFKIKECNFHFDSTHKPAQLCPPGAELAKVTVNERMTPKEYERDVRHFVISTLDVDLPFHLGDAIALYPQNAPEDVEEVLQWFCSGKDLKPDAALSLELLDDTLNARLQALCKQRTTLRQLFTEVLDIFGKPTRAFYTNLAVFADKKEAASLMAISGGDEFKQLQVQSATHWDIFKRFPSAKPSLEHLLGLLPPIKPRLYSIASSQDYTPGVIELTIVINQWTPRGKPKRTGTSTKYVAALPVGARVPVAMTHGTFIFPPDECLPMVMTGLGTGIAPIRSFVQDRFYKKKQGIEVGPMIVIYGCRHEKEEFFYKEEWKKYQEEGVLTKLINAFSHDPPHFPPTPLFVDQKMAEHQALLGDMLGNKGGYFYMCGLAVAVPAIDEALKNAAVATKMCTEQGKDEWLVELKKAGRYSQESY